MSATWDLQEMKLKAENQILERSLGVIKISFELLKKDKKINKNRSLSWSS